MSPLPQKSIKEEVREKWRKLRDEDYEYMSEHQIANWWLKEFDSLMAEKVKEIEHKAHFSKLAGTRYDGYIYYKDVITLLSPIK